MSNFWGAVHFVAFFAHLDQETAISLLRCIDPVGINAETAEKAPSSSRQPMQAQPKGCLVLRTCEEMCDAKYSNTISASDNRKACKCPGNNNDAKIYQ